MLWTLSFFSCRQINLPRVLMQTGQSQAPQRRWWKKVTSSSQEVNVAGRCRCPQPPQQTTTKKRLQRRTRLAIVVCTCQVRNVYLTFYPFKNSFKNFFFYCLFVCFLTLVGKQTQTTNTQVVPIIHLILRCLSCLSQKSLNPSWPPGRPCKCSRTWRSTSPSAPPPSPAAWRARSAQIGSWIPSSSGTSRGNPRKVCLSLLSAIWWCPAVSSSFWGSDRLGWTQVKGRKLRLWTTEQGRVYVRQN